MKKGTKIWLIIVVVLVLLGVTLCVSALAAGLSYKDLESIVENKFASSYSWLEDMDDLDDRQKNNTTETYVPEANSSSVSGEFLEHLMVDMDFGNLTIKSTDKQEVYLEIENADDEKYFEFNSTKSGITVSNCNEAFWIGVKAPEAILYIPENIYFEYIELDIDAGSCSIQTALNTVQLHVDVDAGSAAISNMYADWLDMDCDAGSIAFSGIAATGGTIEVDAGDIELQIYEKSFEDYDYDIEVSAGTLIINDKKYSGLDYEEYIHNKAAGNWTLSCEAGKIDMKVNN